MSEDLGQFMQSKLEFRDQSLPLAVVVTNTPWDEPPRMRHHVTQQLLRWYNVLYIEFFPYGKIAPDTKKKINDKLIIYTVGRDTNISPLLYSNIPYYHTKANLQASNRIVNCISSFRPTTLYLFNFVYDFIEIIQRKKFDFSAYFCFDEFPRMQRAINKKNYILKRWQWFIRQKYENEVAVASNICFTPHTVLKTKLEKVGALVEMLYHAHNFELKNTSTSKIIKKTKGNIIHVGFLGYIHYRLRVDWLTLLTADEKIQVHLAGPVNANIDLNPLMQKSNVVLEGALPESELLDFFNQMDVLIIPYHENLPENEVLTTTSKLFQYISSQRPIVISDLPNFLNFPYGVIYKSGSADAFISNIHKAVDEDNDELRKVRFDIASENTWEHRGDQIKKIIDRFIQPAINL
jgi:hypothetical protein